MGGLVQGHTTDRKARSCDPQGGIDESKPRTPSFPGIHKTTRPEDSKLIPNEKRNDKENTALSPNTGVRPSQALHMQDRDTKLSMSGPGHKFESLF